MNGRIPQHFIDDLLARIDIVDVIDAVVPLKKSGASYKACCPFHNEKTPSFTVSQEKQFYHCFGCGVHGTAIGFMMDYERLSFPETIEQLAQQAGLEIPYETESTQQQQRKSEKDLVLGINQKASSLYQKQLRLSEAAKNYLQNRGLSGKTALKFTIGFIPDQWDYVLNTLGTNDAEINTLKQAGLLSGNDQGRIYDKFRERIMFPIRNRKGDVIAFGGRVIHADKQPKYLNSPETVTFHKSHALYGVYEMRKFAKDITYILVVEGYMDVVMLAEHGIDTAVATLGTATTTDHIRQLLRTHTHIVFCFDGDSAGKQAAWRALTNALPALNDTADLRFLFLPDGEDPDSLIQKEGKSQFEQRIHAALPLAEYLFNKAKQALDLTQISDKAKFATLVLPLIKQVTAPVLQALLYKRLEDDTRLGIDKLNALSAGEQHTTPTNDETFAQADHTPSKRSRKINQLKFDETSLAISALLALPELALSTNSDAISAIENKGVKFLVEMIELIQDSPNISPPSLLQRYADTPYQARLATLQADYLLTPRDQVTIEKEFTDALKQIIKKANQQRYQALLEKQQLSLAEKQELNRLLKDD